MVLPRLAPLLYANSFNEKKKLKERPSVKSDGESRIFIFTWRFFHLAGFPVISNKFHPKSRIS